MQNEQWYPLRVVVLLIVVIVVYMAAMTKAEGKDTKVIPLGKPMSFHKMVVCNVEQAAVLLAVERNKSDEHFFESLRPLFDARVCGIATGTVIYLREVFGEGIWHVFEIQAPTGELFYEVSDWRLESV